MGQGAAYQIIISSFKLFRQHFGAGEAKPFPHIHLMVHAGLVDGLGITGDALCFQDLFHQPGKGMKAGIGEGQGQGEEGMGGGILPGGGVKAHVVRQEPAAAKAAG